MQPHSMCAIALAGYIWHNVKFRPRGYNECLHFKTTYMDVEYQMYDRTYRTLGYRLSNIELTIDADGKLNLCFEVTRSHGGDSCRIKIVRNSESSEPELEHSTHHASGLREKFRISNNLINGHHENSLKYNKFDGTFYNDFKTLKLDSDVWVNRDEEIKSQRDKKYKKISYTLTITGLPELTES